MKSWRPVFSALGTVTTCLLLIGCSMAGEQSASAVENAPPPPEGIKRAIAIVEPTRNSNVHGRVIFTETQEGVHILADVTGLIPGLHGFHIHEYGDCSSSDGSSTGGHFNPRNQKHGAPDSQERHLGDLGNIEADEKGHGHYERIDKMITLNGIESIVGKSVVIHSDSDDFTSQPAGNSGKKLACGPIKVHE